MRPWIRKAILQKSISLLPWGRKIHDFLQEKVLRSNQISDFFLTDRLQHVERHVQAWRKHQGGIPNRSLELGTGWYPIVPLGMYLCGVNEVHTVDRYAHLRDRYVQKLGQFLVKWHQSGQLQSILPSIRADRWETFLRLQEHGFRCRDLPTMGIFPVVADARKLAYEDGYFDFIHSNNTFEHLPLGILSPLLNEFVRVCHEDGLQSHYIDLVDHYSYHDPAIGPYHFLQYSDRQWKWIENRFQSQNRMRVNEHRRLFKEAGLQILDEVVEKGPKAALTNIPLSIRFQNMAEEDVSVTYVQFIARSAH
ncbi:MAG: class I SAM-dependent methyltransferase [Bacteroidota bacterium]